MTLTVEIDPARRTAAFREVSFLAAGDRCSIVLDGVRGADAATLSLALYRDAASASPVASCASFSAVPGHPRLASGDLALDTFEMAAWFGDAVPEESDDSDDAALPRASASAESRLAARASLAERSVRTDGWLVVADVRRVWAACRVPVLLRPGAGTSGAVDPVSVAALVEALVGAAMEESAEAAVAAAAASKADKAAPSVAGNLASLDASGNLADSGATPASIKAAAVAEVVANAPGTMDTLKEIADILGSSQQSGTVLKRISDLESGKADSSSLAAVATSGSYDDLSGTPAIPAVDAALATRGAAADAKAVGDALRSGFTEWVCDEISEGWTFVSCEWDTVSEIGTGWFANLANGSITISAFLGGNADSVNLEKEAQGNNPGVELSRHLITPTKTSQLANDSGFLTSHQDISGKLDGAAAYPAWLETPPNPYVVGQMVSNRGLIWKCTEAGTTDEPGVSELGWEEVTIGSLLSDKQDALSPQQTGYINAVPGKADKTVPSAAGNLAALDAQGNLLDSGAKPSDFAAKSDLPYALVEPGKWEFSGLPSGVTAVSMSYSNYTWILELSDSTTLSASSGGGEELIVGFYGGSGTVTATRPSLPGHLLDRAGNRVVVSGDTTLTPPAANPGYLRDFLVRLEISGSTVPTITFVAPTGETLTYETDGDEFPVPDEAGNWLYSFTESCVAHKFAVSLKKVNEVVQGGA